MDGKTATATQTELLTKIYYDPSSPAGYTSIQKLFDAAKAIDPTITYDIVKNFLLSQVTYTIHHSARTNFPRSKVVASRIGELFMADLGDMQNLAAHNDGVKYLLI